MHSFFGTGLKPVGPVVLSLSSMNEEHNNKIVVQHGFTCFDALFQKVDITQKDLFVLPDSSHQQQSLCTCGKGGLWVIPIGGNQMGVTRSPEL